MHSNKQLGNLSSGGLLSALTIDVFGVLSQRLLWPFSFLAHRYACVF